MRNSLQRKRRTVATIAQVTVAWHFTAVEVFPVLSVPVALVAVVLVTLHVGRPDVAELRGRRHHP